MVHFTKSAEAYIFNVLNLDTTAPSIRAATFANTEAVTLKSRCSSRIIPRYLYLFTTFRGLLSKVKLNSVHLFRLLLKCTTFVLSLFTFSLYDLHQLSMQFIINCNFSSLSTIITMPSANANMEIIISSTL